MPKIFPFAGIMPPKHLASLATTRSYISYTNDELVDKLKNNPFSFMQIINPEYLLPEQTQSSGKDKYLKVRDKFKEFEAKDYFEKDREEHLYVYEQSGNGVSFKGIICCVGVHDYENGRILKHEATLDWKEKVFTEYLACCGFHAEPVLLTHPEDKGLSKLVGLLSQDDPHFDFSTTDEMRHKIWKIEQGNGLEEVQYCLQQHPNFYIADGHHRSASSARLNKEYFSSSNTHPSSRFMACILPSDQLVIKEFNRIVYQTHHLSWEDIVNGLSDQFDIMDRGTGQAEYQSYDIVVSRDTHWVALALKEKNSEECSPSSELIVSKISKHLLEAILDIKDPNDKRIQYFSGNPYLQSEQEIVEGIKNELTILLKPIPWSSIQDVADANEVMPPKSTFVLPKLRSGLVIYSYQ